MISVFFKFVYLVQVTLNFRLDNRNLVLNICEHLPEEIAFSLLIFRDAIYHVFAEFPQFKLIGLFFVGLI